jgi:hypothetical protein
VTYEKEDRPAELKKDRIDDPQAYARALVRDAHYPDLGLEEIYVVWYCYTLGNWKALISTNVKDDQYFEVTHNVARGEIYVDRYRKMSSTLHVRV